MYFIFHDTIPAVSSNAFTFFTYKPNLNKTSSMACAPVGQYGQFGYLVFALATIAHNVNVSVHIKFSLKNSVFFILIIIKSP